MKVILPEQKQKISYFRNKQSDILDTETPTYSPKTYSPKTLSDLQKYSSKNHYSPKSQYSPKLHQAERVFTKQQSPQPGKWTKPEKVKSPIREFSPSAASSLQARAAPSELSTQVQISGNCVRSVSKTSIGSNASSRLSFQTAVEENKNLKFKKNKNVGCLSPLSSPRGQPNQHRVVKVTKPKQPFESRLEEKVDLAEVLRKQQAKRKAQMDKSGVYAPKTFYKKY